MTVTITENVVNYGKNVKGLYVTKINKDNILMNDGDNVLKYYYEPLPNTVVEESQDWLDYTITNRINTDSLNDRFDYSIIKDRDNFRIVTIGDSFTYGLFVKTGDNYPEKLEDFLNNKLECKNIKDFEVINLGSPGHDINYTINRFIKRGIKYNPDLVIWLIQDFNFDVIMEFVLPLMMRPDLKDLPGFDAQTNSYPIWDSVRKEMDKKYSETERLDYHRAALFNLKKYFSGKILFLVFTNIDNKYKKIVDDFVSGRPDTYIFPVTEVSEIEKYKFPDRHPNEEGHKKIASEVFDYLTENHFQDCKRI